MKAAQRGILRGYWESSRLSTATTTGNAIPKLTLADGATVKMADTNAVQSVTTSLSTSGTITVDVTAITKEDGQANASIPLLSAPVSLSA